MSPDGIAKYTQSQHKIVDFSSHLLIFFCLVLAAHVCVYLLHSYPALKLLDLQTLITTWWRRSNRSSLILFILLKANFHYIYFANWGNLPDWNQKSFEILTSDYCDNCPLSLAGPYICDSRKFFRLGNYFSLLVWVSVAIILRSSANNFYKFHVHQCQAQIEIWRLPDIPLKFTWASLTTWLSSDLPLTLTRSLPHLD